MKVRLTSRGVRVRIDDLELARLERGEVLNLRVQWPGGGWQVTLDPVQGGVMGEGGHLRVGLVGVLAGLLDPTHEGVMLDGLPPVTVEKDFGPQHSS